MNRILSVVIVSAFLTTLFFLPVNAKHWYVGPTAGVMVTDLSGLGNPFNVGAQGGFQFDDFSKGAFAIEAAFTVSASKGSVDPSGEWDVTTFGFYGVYRSLGTVYFKGKLGFLNEDITFDVGGFGLSGSDSGLSIGIGGGFEAGPGTLEIEFTIVEADISFIGGSYNFEFGSK